jgi:hypothetical protein
MGRCVTASKCETLGDHRDRDPDGRPFFVSIFCWCCCEVSFVGDVHALVIPAEAGIHFDLAVPVRAVLAYFVVPAKAGIQLLALDLSALTRNPPHIPVLFVAHPCAPVTFSCLPKRK